MALVAIATVGAAGFIAVHRGNPDAFAPRSEASFEAMTRGQSPEPFLRRAETFAVPVSPDFVALGDFLGHGNHDLALAARGGRTLYLLPADGKGGFGAPRSIALAGGVTMLAAGRFGAVQTALLVGADGARGASLALYLAGAKGAERAAEFPLPGAAQSADFGRLVGPASDAAIVAGGKLLILASATRKLEPIPLPLTARAVALGSFVFDRYQAPQLGLLAADGSLQIVAHGHFDPRPWSEQETRQLIEANRHNRPNPLLRPVAGGGWKVIEVVPQAASAQAIQSPALFRARITGGVQDDLVLLNAAAGQSAVLTHAAARTGDPNFVPGELSLMPYSGSPVAALPMRLNVQGRSGMVALHQGAHTPMLLVPSPSSNTFNVNTTVDAIFPGACAAATANECSLREAVLETNARATATTINVPAGTYNLTIGRGASQDYSGSTGALYINNSTTIVGAGQSSTIVQWGTPASGVKDNVIVVNEDVAQMTAASVSISNLTIQGGVNHGTIAVGDGWGGGMMFDTGQNGTATLNLTNVTLTGNSTTDGDGGGLAVFNSVGGAGQATLNGCIIGGMSASAANSANESSSGNAGSGGGIWAAAGAPIAISNTTIGYNNANQTQSGGTPVAVAGQGGGIYLGGDLTPGGSAITSQFSGVSIENNTAGGQGGGIYSNQGLVTGNFTFINANTAGQDGGGLWYNGIAPNAASITDSVFSGNAASGSSPYGNGGGIQVDSEPSNALTVHLSNFNSNTAATGSNLNVAAGTANATENWWGVNTPGSTVNAVAGATLTLDPWVVLGLTANPQTIDPTETSTLTADLGHDSQGASVTGSLDAIVFTNVSFGGATLGSLENPTGQWDGNAQSTVTFQPSGTGVATATVTTNDQTVAVNSAAILTATESGTTVTVTTLGAHNFTVGEQVAISGVSNTGYNTASGSYVAVTGILSATSFTYTASAAGLASGTGGLANAGIRIAEALTPPSIAIAFSPSTVTPNASSTLTFTIVNPNSTVIDAAFPIALPNGLVYAGAMPTYRFSDVCDNFGVSNPSIQGNTVNMPGMAPGNCTVSVSVQATTSGAFILTSAVNSTAAGNGNNASATLSVLAPPAIATGFIPSTIVFGQTSTLNYTLSNPNQSVALSGTSFSDRLPTGVTVAAQNNLTNHCGGGTIAAAPGSTIITANQVSIPAGAGCSISLSVQPTFAGTFQNTAGPVSDTAAGIGVTASAPLQVNQASTTATVTSSPNPSAYGQLATFTASVAAVAPGAGAPTGSVTFADNGNAIGTVNLTGLQAQFNTSALTAGTHSITATYNGDGNFYSSPASIAVAQTVTVPSLVVNTNGDAGAGASDCAYNPTASGAGSCTLRDALAAAAASGGGSITFDATVFAPTNPAAANTIALGSAGTMSLPNNTTLTGPAVSGASQHGVIIDGGNAYSIFNFNASSGVAGLVGLTLANGGGGSQPGGILNDGTLTVTGCTFNNSTSLRGGAILNLGTLTVTGSTFNNNSASLGGGAILSLGILTVTGSTFSGNSAGQGGAIFNNGGTFTSIDNIYAGNSASSGQGGAINNQASTSIAERQNVFFSNTGGDVSGFTMDASDVTGQDTKLTALGWFGGPTQTMLPMPGSAALCAGTATLGNDASGNALSLPRFDQRGDARATSYNGTACVDAGAVQTHYTLQFDQQPSLVKQNAAISPAPTVELDENGAPFADSIDTVTIPLTLTTGGGALTGGSAPTSAATGIATYSALSVDTVGQGDVLTAKLTLNANTGAPTIAAISNGFNVASSVAATQRIAAETLTFGQTGVNFTPVAGSGGTAPLGYTVNPSLPAGLGINPQNGAIAGTPAAVLPAAQYTVTVADATGAQASASFWLTVNQASTTTAVSSSRNPSVYGQPVNFTATVMPVAPGGGMPDGTVNFTIDGTPYPPVPLTAGQSQLVSPTLSPGSHAVSAVYSGSTHFLGGSGALPGSQIIQQDQTTVNIAVSSNSIALGDTVTLTATASATVAPTGMVVFNDGLVPIGTGVLTPISATSSQATFTTALLSSNSHALHAYFTGGVDFGSNASTPYALTVSPRASSTAVSLNPSSVMIVQPSTATVTVSDQGSMPLGATGLFAATGAPLTGRTGFTSTLIGDGLVLIAGGADASNHVLQSAEIYNAVTGQFTATGSLATARTGAVAILESNGKVLVAGGSADGTAAGALNSAELYDPSTGTFSPSSQTMTAARFGMQAVQLSSSATLIAGGQNGSGVLNSAELYAWSTDTFTATGNMTAARTGAAMQRIAATGQVLVAGGSSDGTAAGALNSIELFDPAANNNSGGFSAVSSTLSAGRYQPAIASTYLGVTLIAGGQNGTGPLNSADLYSPSQNAVQSSQSSLAASRSGANALALPGGLVLLAGGAPSRTAELYDANTDRFFTTGGPLQTDSGLVLTQLNNGDVLAVGLTGASQPAADAELYAPGFQPLGVPQLSSSEISDSIAGPCQLTPANGATSTCAASVTPNNVATSPHVVTASYNGDAMHAVSSSSANLAVTPRPTTTTVSSSQNPSVWGQSVTITASVSTQVGTTLGTVDTVAFYDGTTPLATLPVSFDPATQTYIASYSSAALAVGNHAITASFGGDGNHLSSMGALPGGQQVNQAAATTSLVASAAALVAGQPLTLTATVAAVAPGAGLPTGQVTFFDGLTSLGAVSLNGAGVATLSSSALTADTHSFTASYSGDLNFLAGASSPAVAVTLYPGTIDLGAVAVGATSIAPVLVPIVFPASATPAVWHVLTEGAQGRDFNEVPASTTCQATNYPAGQVCSVAVGFSPQRPGQRLGAVQLFDAQGNILATKMIYGMGAGPEAIFPNNGIAQRTIQLPSNHILVSFPGLAENAHHDLFAANLNQLLEFKADSRGQLPNPPTPVQVGGNFGTITGVAVDGAGDVYVADSTAIWQILADGAGQVSANSSVRQVGALPGATSKLALDTWGNLFLANNNGIFEFAALNGQIPANPPAILLTNGFKNYQSLVVDATGNVLFTAQDTNFIFGIFRIAAVNGQVSPNSSITRIGSGFDQMGDLAIDAAGDLFVNGIRGNNVGIFEVAATNGAVSNSSVPVYLNYSVDSPSGLALDEDGNLFANDPEVGEIFEIPLATPPSSSFASTTEVGKIDTADGNFSATIANIGNQPLNFPVPTAAGAINPSLTTGLVWQAASSTCTQTAEGASAAFSLAPGAGCTLAVAFQPAAPGLNQDSIALTDTSLNAAAPAYATQSITLSGYGIEATTQVPSTVLTVNQPATSFTPVVGSGGNGAISYGIAPPLPAGLTISPSTGTITGTPTANSPATSYTVSVRDTHNGLATSGFSLAVSVAVSATTNDPAASLTVFSPATPFTPVAGTGGMGALSYGIKPALPAGLVFNQQTGEITGTPSTPSASAAYQVTVTDSNGASASNSFLLVVNQATAKIQVKGYTVTYDGQPHTASGTATGVGGVNLIAGLTLSGTTHTAAGVYSTDAWSFHDAGGNYADAKGTVSDTINQAQPSITWSTPSAIVYGTALGAAQLDAVASVAGKLVYTPAAGTVLGAGSQTLAVSFTPADATDYTAASATVHLQVNPAKPTITWAAPSAIVYGTALGAAQLDAVASVAGKLVYTPAAGQVLTAGSHTLVVNFTPADATDYTAASATVALTVDKAAQAIRFTPGSPVTFGVAPIELAAKGGGSGNPVTYALVSGPGSLGGTGNGTLTVTGAGKIVVAADQAGSSNYAAAPEVSASIQVNRAATAIILTAGGARIEPGGKVALTATVSTAAGALAGTVEFNDGSTVLASVPVAAGVAQTAVTLSTTGEHSLTAVYGGDVNHLASNSQAVTVDVLPLDFKLAVSGATSASVLPGATASYQLTLDPTHTDYPGSVAFSVLGLPAGATASFSPASIAANAGSQTVTMTVQTAAIQARVEQGRTNRFALALLLLPLIGLRKIRKRLGGVLSLLLILGGLGASMMLQGCAGRNGFFIQQPSNHTITVTATSGSIAHSVNVTLQIQ